MPHIQLRTFAGTGTLLACLVLAGCGSSSSSSGSATSTPAKPHAAALSLMTPNRLTVGTDPSYPPMESADPSNPSNYIGADPDLAQALAKAMGLRGATLVKGAFDSLITSLEAKRYDVIMSSMNDTPERAKTVNFVDYMTASEGILVKASNPVHANNYTPFCGKTVTVQRGTTELAGLEATNKTCSSKINILSFQADTDAYQAFAAGHADAYTSDLPVIANYIKLNPGKYREAGKPISAGQNYGIAVRKGNPALVTALRNALAKVRSDGQYTAILKKWGVEGAALK